MSLEEKRFKQIAFKDLDEIIEAKIKAEAMRKDKEAEKHAEQEAAIEGMMRRMDTLAHKLDFLSRSVGVSVGAMVSPAAVGASVGV